MKKLQYLIPITFVALFSAVRPWRQMNSSKPALAYQHASEGPAQQLAPAELHKAHEALTRAEQSFLKEPDSYKTKDLCLCRPAQV